MDATLTSWQSSQDQLCLICRNTGHNISLCPWFTWKTKSLTNPSFPGPECARPSPLDAYPLVVETLKQEMCERCRGLSEWHRITRVDPPVRHYYLGGIEHLDLLSACPSCRLIFNITYLTDEDISSVNRGSELVLVIAPTVSRLEKDLGWQSPSGIEACPYADCVYTAVKLTIADWGDHCTTAKALYGDPSLEVSSPWRITGKGPNRSSKLMPGNKRPLRTAARRTLPLSTYESRTSVEEAIDAVALADVELRCNTSLGVRKVDPECPNYGIIKDWLGRCDALHPTTCRPIVSESLKKIKLVNVETRQIVMYPPEGHDYLALSYVWGKAKQASYKLGDVLPILPSTLEDALTVTRMLGKRYLWADSLCIDQRDDVEKAVQIALMSAIYSGAWVTIVSLSGLSANSGLPRVGTLDGVVPQLKYVIWGKRMLSLMPTLAQQLSWSCWADRAWTFQEGLLSPRCLFFTKHQVYFECNAFQCCESLDDSVSPFHISSDEEQRAALLVAEHEENSPRRPENIVGKGVLRDPFRQMTAKAGRLQNEDKRSVYHELLKSFTKRQMSYDADSLNAFSAIMTRLQDNQYEGGFVHGLPAEDISRALLWYHSSKSRRRVDFPTWSWAGWEGEVCKYVVDGARKFIGAFMPPLRVWNAGNSGRPELIYEFNPLAWMVKETEEGEEKERQSVNFERDPIIRVAKVMLADIPQVPQELGSGELVIEGIVLRVMLVRSNYGHPREGRLEIRHVGMYEDVKFQGHDAEMLVNTRQGKEQDFLLLSRELVSYNERVYTALLLIDWEGDIAYRVGVATLEVTQDRFGLLESLSGVFERRLLKLK